MVALIRRRAHHGARHVSRCSLVAAVLFALAFAIFAGRRRPRAGPVGNRTASPVASPVRSARTARQGHEARSRGRNRLPRRLRCRFGLVTVAAVGDVLLHDAVQKFAATRPDGYPSLFASGRRPDPRLPTSRLPIWRARRRPESPRPGARPPRRIRLWDDRVYSGYPMFNYHPSVLGALKQAGFDVLLTANNHALDRYAVGADRTIDAIRSGRPQTHRNAQARRQRASPGMP